MENKSFEPSKNRAGQALDLEALEKLISPLADFTHHDECGARESYDADGDEIDDDPLEFLKGCDCGLDRSWAALQMIRAEQARIRELEARTPAPDALKLVDGLNEWKRDIQAGRNAGTSYWVISEIIPRIDAILAGALTALSQPLPVGAAAIAPDSDALRELKSHMSSVPPRPTLVAPVAPEPAIGVREAGYTGKPGIGPADIIRMCKAMAAISDMPISWYQEQFNTLAWMVEDLVPIQSPTLPPNPKGREPIEIKVTFDRKLQFGPMMEWSQIEIPDGVRYFREIEVPKGREQEEGGEHNGQHF